MIVLLLLALTLPPGVTGVSFGRGERFKDAAGKDMCAIVKPLPEPAAFERGVTEISYGVALAPRVVKSAAARVIAPGGQELVAASCNIFTPVKGGFSQTQLGSTISRADKRPLLPGAYRVRITIDGHTAEIPFSVK
jgi:hypothetical protein